jgi:hypothetical protein
MTTTEALSEREQEALEQMREARWTRSAFRNGQDGDLAPGVHRTMVAESDPDRLRGDGRCSMARSGFSGLSEMFLLGSMEFLPPLIAEEVILIEQQYRPAQDHEVLRILERFGLVVDHAVRLVEIVPGDQIGVTHPKAALQHQDMGVAEVLVPWRNRTLQRAYEHRYSTGFRADPKYLHEVPIGIEALRNPLELATVDQSVHDL